MKLSETIKPTILSYDTQKYDFNSIMKQIMNVEDLTNLHEGQSYAVVCRETDQNTHWHRLYYEQFSRLVPLYHNFLNYFIKKEFAIDDGHLIYQKIPTIRVHLVGNLAVGEWHKDSAYGHHVNEINCWLPFVNVYDTNTIWIEYEDQRQPFNLLYGEILLFPGTQLCHGNQINTTKDTRVSIDFRLIERDRFVPTNNKSVNMYTILDIGGYFESM